MCNEVVTVFMTNFMIIDDFITEKVQFIPVEFIYRYTLNFNVGTMYILCYCNFVALYQICKFSSCKSTASHKTKLNQCRLNWIEEIRTVSYKDKICM